MKAVNLKRETLRTKMVALIFKSIVLTLPLVNRMDACKNNNKQNSV